MTEDEIYRKAKKKVIAKKGFYTHFGVYCVGILFFFALNYLTYDDAGMWWAFFPVLGWGMGVVAHYIAVFGLSSAQGDDWEERQLEKEVAKLQRKRNMELDIQDDITLPDDELELKEVIVNSMYQLYILVIYITIKNTQAKNSCASSESA